MLNHFHNFSLVTPDATNFFEKIKLCSIEIWYRNMPWSFNLIEFFNRDRSPTNFEFLCPVKITNTLKHETKRCFKAWWKMTLPWSMKQNDASRHDETWHCLEAWNKTMLQGMMKHTNALKQETKQCFKAWWKMTMPWRMKENDASRHDEKYQWTRYVYLHYLSKFIFPIFLDRLSVAELTCPERFLVGIAVQQSFF